MKRFILFTALLLLTSGLSAQSPQKISYQGIVRNAEGKLVQGANVRIRVTILQGSLTGTPVYTEVHTTSTNNNGLVTLEIGAGNTSGNFSLIDWTDGPYFIMTETDPTGGTNYTVQGTTQLLSVPYALYSEKAGNGFSGDYNDLINKPVTDGSETKLRSGLNISISGQGTSADPYLISGSNNKIVLTSNQTWTVPANVSKIKVELWGASGGGGGAGAYSYSYNLNNGGDGGSGGFSEMEMDVSAGQSFSVTIGQGGYPGINGYAYSGQSGDTNGGDGGDSWFETMKASGGKGGKRGSFAPYTVHGEAGMYNAGTITAFADPPNSNILTVFTGMPRSYLYDRVLTSKPGRGGSVTGYSYTSPKSGESGCAVITFWE